MRTTGQPYSVVASDQRTYEMLAASESDYPELASIPSAESLTYAGGAYVNCAALFIDVRDSSRLPNIHRRPVLAKIYRAYISECVAILNQDPNCRQVIINGDCVAGIFDAPTNADLATTFVRACQLNGWINIFNWRLAQQGYSQIRCGIGLDYGRALMLKAGFKGSGINELIWMGDVVNNASNLCSKGNKDGRLPIIVSKTVYDKLASRSDYLTHLFEARDGFLGISIGYEADAVSKEMDDWLNLQRNAQPGGGLLSTDYSQMLQAADELAALATGQPVKAKSLLNSAYDDNAAILSALAQLGATGEIVHGKSRIRWL